MKKYLFLLGFASLFASCSQSDISFMKTSNQLLRDSLKKERSNNSFLREKIITLTLETKYAMWKKEGELRECAEMSKYMNMMHGAKIDAYEANIIPSSSRSHSYSRPKLEQGDYGVYHGPNDYHLDPRIKRDTMNMKSDTSKYNRSIAW